MAKREATPDEARALIEEERVKATLIRDGVDTWLEHLDDLERGVAKEPGNVMAVINDQRRWRREPLARAVADVMVHVMGEVATVDEVWAQLFYFGRFDERGEVAKTMGWLAKRAGNPWLTHDLDSGTFDVAPSYPFLPAWWSGTGVARPVATPQRVPFPYERPDVVAGEVVECLTSAGEWVEAIAESEPRFDDESAVGDRCHLTVAVTVGGQTVNWPAEDIRVIPTSDVGYEWAYHPDLPRDPRTRQAATRLLDVSPVEVVDPPPTPQTPGPAAPLGSGSATADPAPTPRRTESHDPEPGTLTAVECAIPCAESRPADVGVGWVEPGGGATLTLAAETRALCRCGHPEGAHPWGYSYGRERAMACKTCNNGACQYYEREVAGG